MKNKNRIILYRKYDEQVVRVEIPADSTISEVLEAVGDFMRGCGYHFDGDIEVVNYDYSRSEEKLSSDFMDDLKDVE